MRDSQLQRGQRRVALGIVAVLMVGLVGLTAAPLTTSASAGQPATRPGHRIGSISSSSSHSTSDQTTGADGTAEPKTGQITSSTTTFSDEELGFTVSWEEGVWAAQRDHVPTAGALAGVLLVNIAGGLLYIDAIPAGDLTDAADCVASNQSLIEGFETVTDVTPLEDADGAGMSDESGDPAFVISTAEIDGEPAYLYVGCASIDGGAAFLAFTYYLTQGDGLDADKFIAGWLPDVQAVVDSLDRE